MPNENVHGVCHYFTALGKYVIDHRHGDGGAQDGGVSCRGPVVGAKPGLLVGGFIGTVPHNTPHHRTGHRTGQTERSASNTGTAAGQSGRDWWWAPVCGSLVCGGHRGRKVVISYRKNLLCGQWSVANPQPSLSELGMVNPWNVR